MPFPPKIMLFQIQRSLSFKGSEQTLESTTEQDCFLNIIKKIGHHFLTLKILNGIHYKGQQLEADGIGLDFIGQKPEGVPEDVDDMVRTQVTPEQEVYSGAYRRQIAEVTETEVDNFEGVQLGWNVAVNLDDNYKLPHLALVKEVTNSLYIYFSIPGNLCFDFSVVQCSLRRSRA